MAGNTIQVGSSNGLLRVKSNGIVVAGASDPCCCGVPCNVSALTSSSSFRTDEVTTSGGTYDPCNGLLSGATLTTNQVGYPAVSASSYTEGQLISTIAVSFLYDDETDSTQKACCGGADESTWTAYLKVAASLGGDIPLYACSAPSGYTTGTISMSETGEQSVTHDSVVQACIDAGQVTAEFSTTTSGSRTWEAYAVLQSNNRITIYVDSSGSLTGTFLYGTPIFTTPAGTYRCTSTAAHSSTYRRGHVGATTDGNLRSNIQQWYRFTIS